MSEEVKEVTSSLYDEVDWEKVAFYKIEKKEFEKIKLLNKRTYCTFLGPSEKLQFFMFRPLPWGEFADIRRKGLDKESTHEAILSICLLWPQADPLLINSIESGLVLTLVYQILAVSNFLKSPDKALEMILEA